MTKEIAVLRVMSVLLVLKATLGYKGRKVLKATPGYKVPKVRPEIKVTQENVDRRDFKALKEIRGIKATQALPDRKDLKVTKETKAIKEMSVHKARKVKRVIAVELCRLTWLTTWGTNMSH